LIGQFYVRTDLILRNPFFYFLMKTDDLALVLAYSQCMYPSEFERLSAIYPPRLVMIEMINKHPTEMIRILRMTFRMSDEYRDAIKYIEELDR